MSPLPVDPHLAPLLELLTTAPPLHAGSPQEARVAFRKLSVGGRQPEQVVPVATVAELAVPGPAGEIGARLYRPRVEGPTPTVVLFHGGGWVVGDLDTHDNLARSICHDCAAVVISIDYRRAPEARFPAAVDDALAATRWVASHLDELGGDDRLAVAGDSAGGNLAAVVAQQLRDEAGPELAGQLLIYPATDLAGHYPSRRENGEGYFLDLPTVRWFTDHYAPDADQHADPRLSPLRHHDLSGLPPAVVVTAQYDPLRDEGEAYADALAEAGVSVEVRRFETMIHGFVDMGAVSPVARAAVDETCALFARVLAR